jgi:5-hydroxyisourate hydrolase
VGALTTHVLDTALGRPAAGILVELYRIPGDGTALASTRTNNDGRCDTPLLEGEEFEAGEYELVFHAGQYFDRLDGGEGNTRFLDRVVIRFGVNDADEHYHVPLLLSPHAYSTYRGS